MDNKLNKIILINWTVAKKNQIQIQNFLIQKLKTKNNLIFYIVTQKKVKKMIKAK